MVLYGYRKILSKMSKVIRINKVCEDCKWNAYPECHGTILEDGSYLNIETGIEKDSMFVCGVKFRDNIFYLKPINNTVDQRVKILEEKLAQLEKKLGEVK